MTENVFIIDVERRGGGEVSDRLRTEFSTCPTTAPSYVYLL